MDYIDIVFEPPPEDGSKRVVTIEDTNGDFFSAGTWEKRTDGKWALRLNYAPETIKMSVGNDAFEKRQANWDLDNIIVLSRLLALLKKGRHCGAAWVDLQPFRRRRPAEARRNDKLA